jgi:hypothetical protein
LGPFTFPDMCFFCICFSFAVASSSAFVCICRHPYHSNAPYFDTVCKRVSYIKTLEPFSRNIQNTQVCALHEPSCLMTDPASMSTGTVHVHCSSSGSRLQLVRTHGIDTFKTHVLCLHVKAK